MAEARKESRSRSDRRPLWRVSLLCAALLMALCCGAGARAVAQSNCDSPESALAQAELLRDEWKAGSLRKAIGKLEEAAVCWREAGRVVEQAEAQRRAGEIHLTLGDYQDARVSFDAAVMLLREGNDSARRAIVLSDLTLALIYLGQIEQAAATIDEALSLARASSDARAQLRAHTSAGMLSYMRGDAQGALDSYKSALTFSKAVSDQADNAQLLLNIGYVHGDAGELSEALSFYNQALALWRAAKHRAGEASTRTSMGLVYTLLGDRQQALSCLSEQALPLLRELGDRVGEAASYNNIGYVYQTLGEYESALENYNHAFDIYKEIGLVIGQALTIQYMGEMLELSGRTREALDSYERSLSWSRQVKNVLLEAGALNHLGALSYALGKKQEAFEHHQRALAVYQQAGHLRGQATSLNNIGYYFLTLGQWQKALENYDRALPLCRLARDNAGEALTLYNIARARRGLGDLNGAREAIASAVKISETLRSNVASNTLRASYLASVHQQFDLYVAVLMELAERAGGNSAASLAFETSERGHARSLLEMLTESSTDIRRGVDQSLLRREQELARQLSAKAERRVKLLAQKASAQELATIERGLEALAIEYRQVQGQIRTTSPRYAALVQPTPLSLAEIQQRVLDADTLLLEYSLGEERSYVWAVTTNTLKYYKLPPRAEVEQLARRFYRLLTERNRTIQGENEEQRHARLERADAEYAKAAVNLSQMVLGPVAGELGSKRVVIVGDGALQYVPFSALPDPSVAGEGAEARRPPLVLGHEVLNLPSASVLAVLREEIMGRPPAPKAVAVIADPIFDSGDERISSAIAKAEPQRANVGARIESSAPLLASRSVKALRGFDEESGAGLARLPFSRREAQAIMEVVPEGEGLLALDFRASRATVLGGELAKYRVVHFATHGILNSTHPELSGIVLSLFDKAGQSQAGFLELNEIYNLDLSADLVVLSACQTALGKEVRGEGLISLTRGFMYAGAPRVIASLWKVDDAATARLMGEFYKVMIGQKMPPSAALRAAQIQMWRQNRWRSPYYWAAFTLQGEWK